MKEVWKFELFTTIKLQMPKKATILCVKDIEGVPCIYAEIDTENKYNTEERIIGVFDTGDSLPIEKNYIGTLRLDWRVVHFYEIYN